MSGLAGDRRCSVILSRWSRILSCSACSVPFYPGTDPDVVIAGCSDYSAFHIVRPLDHKTRMVGLRPDSNLEKLDIMK